MSTAGEAFQKGDIQGAIAAATAAVRASPREPGLRWLMAEMLLFAGDTERADRALDAVVQEQPSPAVLEFRKLLRAEEARKQCFVEGRVPKFQGEDPTPAQRAALQALTHLRFGDAAAAVAATTEAETARARTPGQAGSERFDDLRDADDVLAPILEVLTNAGEYMWVPFERLRSLTFEEAKRPRDLYWRKCVLELKDGTEGHVFVPVTYPWAKADTPAPLRLGRETDWIEGDGGPVRGVGQRVWLAGESALPITEATTIQFDETR
ncbi:MAG TPA: type VI secretion system accessory protein TagJ [Acetobacteraceae bacterium]|nr:type VI secretion system accessory protein TagJ [Acetobacteraceae bacterium]